MVQHLLVVRGQPPSLGPLRSLVGALCVGGRGPGLLDRVLAVLGSPGEVEASTLPHLTHLAHLLCLLVAHLPPGQEQVRARVTRSLARGVTAWLEAGKEKRGLGLALVSAVLERLGERGPEWQQESEQVLEHLRGLCGGQGEEQVVVGDHRTVLEEWRGVEVISVVVGCGVKSEQAVKENSIEDIRQVDTEDPESTEDLDSDDDDLPAYDMSGDTVVTEDNKVSRKIHILQKYEYKPWHSRYQSSTSVT